MSNPEGRMKRRRASSTSPFHLPILPATLFASLLFLLLPKPIHAGFFRGAPPPGPDQCTYVEEIYIEDAVNALAKCVETSPDGIKYALNKEDELGQGYVLGGLELKKLNQCLEKVKKDKGEKEMDEECVKYLKKFQETGNSSDGKEPAGKVAKKLMYDYDKFCYCMATIDPSEIFCYGMGVVRVEGRRAEGREGWY
eukprot:evm.model.NODE_4518_length_20302_cov_39.696136.1